MARSDPERIEWCLDFWANSLPEKGRKGLDRLAPLLIKVYDGRELTREDRVLAGDLLHDLAWMGWLTSSVAHTFKKATKCDEDHTNRP